MASRGILPRRVVVMVFGLVVVIILSPFVPFCLILLRRFRFVVSLVRMIRFPVLRWVLVRFVLQMRVSVMMFIVLLVLYRCRLMFPVVVLMIRFLCRRRVGPNRRLRVLLLCRRCRVLGILGRGSFRFCLLCWLPRSFRSKSMTQKLQ